MCQDAPPEPDLLLQSLALADVRDFLRRHHHHLLPHRPHQDDGIGVFLSHTITGRRGEEEEEKSVAMNSIAVSSVADRQHFCFFSTCRFFYSDYSCNQSLELLSQFCSQRHSGFHDHVSSMQFLQL
jgi:hypothetical protein